MSISNYKYEFELRVKATGPKSYGIYDHVDPSKGTAMEVKEELTFKALSATDCIRKLLDYLL